VLSIHVDYVPKFQGYIPVSTSTTAVGIAPGSLLTPVLMCPFHEDNTNLGSFSHGIAHEGNKFSPANERLSLSNKMRDIDEGDFSKTSSLSVTPYGVKFYFAGTTNGSTDVINWGSYVATYMCQFRSFTDNNTQITTTRSQIFDDTKSNLSICTSTEIKQQVPKDSKESKLKDDHQWSCSPKSAFTQYGQEFILVPRSTQSAPPVFPTGVKCDSQAKSCAAATPKPGSGTG